MLDITDLQIYNIFGGNTYLGGIYMLINYYFKNFRSFKEMTSLTMRATSQTTFNENLIRDYEERILPSAVIYGANASGKSNVISSLSVFRNIVISGSISANTYDLNNLELYPFAHWSENRPMIFGIDFTNNGKRFVYEISILVKTFEKGPRKIIFEKLDIVNKKKSSTLFVRDENSVQISTDKKSLEILELEETFILEINKKLNENLDSDELFLARGFKSIINNDIANDVIDFFADKIYAINDFTLKSAALKITSEENLKENFSLWNNLLEGFVKGADFGPQSIRFKNKNSDEHSADMALFSLYQKDEKRIMIPSELMESRGTLKLIDFAVAFQTFFQKGGVFIIDEFDAALHPEIVKGIISLFNNQQYNKAGAQLIFSTHNPIYLNNKIFRRDQILFVEKDKMNYESTLYSLADFGSIDVRNDENYLINYFKGKYSSLPFIDFSKLLIDKENANV